ncbi:MAG: HEPN domain-containing protein [Candidatus Helarchaeota archaeon]
MNRSHDWLEQARRELEAAKDLYNTKHYAWTCFTCQHSAEKSLKSILEKYNIPSFGHNLINLISEVEKLVKIPNKIKNACFILNRYYIPTRYPDAYPSGVPAEMFNNNDAFQALKLAEEVYKFAEKITK